jgi:acyl dehydratase
MTARRPASADTPLRLIRHHGAMLMAGGRILLHAAQLGRKRGPAQQIAAVSRLIAPPAEELVEHYIAWCGAAGRYQYQLPPHMVSQWSLPLVSELLLQMPFRLTSVINQGVTMRVNGALPRNTPLAVTAQVEWAEQTSGRGKVVLAISTGTREQPALVETRLHMSFMLPGKRAAKAEVERRPEPAWQPAGLWQAGLRDGLRFALLTGDFNPIHWCGPLARRSVFGGTVLHGFGSFVRSYELLTPGALAELREIDVRFVRPVRLPSAALQVELAPSEIDGWRPLRLTSGDGTLHLIGKLR